MHQAVPNQLQEAYRSSTASRRHLDNVLTFLFSSTDYSADRLAAGTALLSFVKTCARSPQVPPDVADECKTFLRKRGVSLLEYTIMETGAEQTAVMLSVLAYTLAAPTLAVRIAFSEVLSRIPEHQGTPSESARLLSGAVDGLQIFIEKTSPGYSGCQDFLLPLVIALRSLRKRSEPECVAACGKAEQVIQLLQRNSEIVYGAELDRAERIAADPRTEAGFYGADSLAQELVLAYAGPIMLRKKAFDFGVYNGGLDPVLQLYPFFLDPRQPQDFREAVSGKFRDRLKDLKPDVAAVCTALIAKKLAAKPASSKDLFLFRDLSSGFSVAQLTHALCRTFCDLEDRLNVFRDGERTDVPEYSLLLEQQQLIERTAVALPDLFAADREAGLHDHTGSLLCAYLKEREATKAKIIFAARILEQRKIDWRDSGIITALCGVLLDPDSVTETALGQVVRLIEKHLHEMSIEGMQRAEGALRYLESRGYEEAGRVAKSLRQKLSDLDIDGFLFERAMSGSPTPGTQG